MAAIGLLPIAAAATAAMLAGVQLPSAVEVSGERLELVACGVRDTWWIDHYVVGLYVPPGTATHAVQDPTQPKAVRMVIVDSRYLPDSIPERWREPLAEEMRREPMVQLHRAFERLSDGDVVSLAYAPGEGVMMSVNGGIVLRTDGHEVIEAILRAWAERDPISGKLQRLALGHPC